MKKGKLLSILALASCFIAGCGCSKIDETTYTNAVNTFKNTDAISFSRIEVISKAEETIYTKKSITAEYVFNANKEVMNMSYSIKYYDGSSNGGISEKQTKEYYYSEERATLYTYSKVGQSQIERYKESDVTYNSKFNINTCMTLECQNMIVGNFVPMFNLNEVSEFGISGDDKGGSATFKAMCPSYENCASNSQTISYTVTINDAGNIDTISYDIINGDTTHSIKYLINGLGSNNVSVDFPIDLESYIEK